MFKNKKQPILWVIKYFYKFDQFSSFFISFLYLSNFSHIFTMQPAKEQKCRPANIMFVLAQSMLNLMVSESQLKLDVFFSQEAVRRSTINSVQPIKTFLPDYPMKDAKFLVKPRTHPAPWVLDFSCGNGSQPRLHNENERIQLHGNTWKHVRPYATARRASPGWGTSKACTTRQILVNFPVDLFSGAN